MIAFLLRTLLMGNFLLSLFNPWVGIVLYYVFALLVPQNIWFWAFQGLRPFLLLLVPVLLGTMIKILTRGFESKFICTKLVKLALSFWAIIVFSFYFGPFVKVQNEHTFFDSSIVLINISKTFLPFFCAIVLLDSFKKIKMFWGAGVITSFVMIFWANNQYFSGLDYGRLNGPFGQFGGIYYDENIFATLLIVTLPFLYYFGAVLKVKILRWLNLIVVLFGWHAIFLTGSRGGLISLGCCIAVIAFRSKRKIIKFCLIPLFLIVFAWQGGNLLMERTTSLGDYKEESSAVGRLQAWNTAIKMVMSHPFTGVGIGSFGQAYSSFSPEQPRIAHNTFFQLLGECGLAGGILYLLLISLSIRAVWKPVELELNDLPKEKRYLWAIKESCLTALIGFFICSLFLSLEQFEFFYYLIVIANFYSKQNESENEFSNIESTDCEK